MQFSSNLFISEGLEEKKDKIMKKMVKKRKIFPVYCITLPRNPHNLLEIIEYHQFLQKHYGIYEPYEVGIAGSKEEATTLVIKIIETVYNKTSGFDMKEYFS